MIRFVGHNSDGLPQKRSQSLRACDHCRKRKKRCIHSLLAEDESPVPTVVPVQNISTPVSTQQSSIPELNFQVDSSSSLEGFSRLETTHISSSGDADNESDGEEQNGDRFVGSLNPESIFLAATSPQTDGNSREDTVGIWIPRKSLANFTKQSNDKTKSETFTSNSLLSNILLPYMQRQCQQLLPSAAHYASLYRIYVQEVHPIFPVIDLETLGTKPADKSAGLLLIKQAICLAASCSPRASNYLRLPTSDAEIVENGASNFASQLASAICTSINLGFVEDQVVIIQALTTLALFTQFSHQSNLSAELAARAISHAQTIGLHLKVPSTRKNSAYLTRLFCCVWATDKLNAAFKGRPTMIHDHDFGRDLEQSIAAQDGCFRLLLKVTSLLDKVIALYRPAGIHAEAAVSTSAKFEDLIYACDASRVPSGLLATVELLFHAVTILSCRPSSSTSISLSLEAHESLAAANVVSIIGTEFRDQISHMPFAPYALSLSLRVFYRDLRFGSKSPFGRNRARKQLLSTCKLLQDLFTDTFPAAVKAAELAEQTVKEMDKVYNDVLQQSASSKSRPDTFDHSQQQGLPNDVGPATTDTVYDPYLMSFDDSAFEGLSDINVFELFDSGFCLDAIDSALMDNMALALPLAVNSSSVHSMD